MYLEEFVDPKLAALNFSRKEFSYFQSLEEEKEIYCKILWKHDEFSSVFGHYTNEYDKYIEIDNGWCYLDNVKIVGVHVQEYGFWPCDDKDWPYDYRVNDLSVEYPGMGGLRLRAGQTGCYKQ